MTVMNKEVAIQCSGCKVINTTCSVCHVSHDQSLHVAKPTIKRDPLKKYCSRISAMVHANISNPSGICKATSYKIVDRRKIPRLDSAFLTCHTVLCISKL